MDPGRYIHCTSIRSNNSWTQRLLDALLQFSLNRVAWASIACIWHHLNEKSTPAIVESLKDERSQEEVEEAEDEQEGSQGGGRKYQRRHLPTHHHPSPNGFWSWCVRAECSARSPAKTHQTHKRTDAEADRYRDRDVAEAISVRYSGSKVFDDGIRNQRRMLFSKITKWRGRRKNAGGIRKWAKDRMKEEMDARQTVSPSQVGQKTNAERDYQQIPGQRGLRP